ncbi:sodium:solute symporter family transporter, partial [Mitsuokella jalaludinii]
MDISLFQLVVICATIAVVLGFGIRAARSVHSTKGFSVGGRSAGVPLVAGGIAGTCVGGGATVGTAQLAATVGLSAWWFTIGSGVGLIIMGLFYARPLRRTALETIPQFLAQNFGLTCGVFSSIVSSIGILFSAVASCLPAIYIIAAIFGIPFLPATVLLILTVAAYAFFGGMKSAG